MSLVLPPSPPKRLGTTVSDLIALIEAMDNDQRTLVLKLLVAGLPNLPLGDTVPDIGTPFVNNSKFLVVAE